MEREQALISLSLCSHTQTHASVQALSHVWLCDLMDCSTPGFPVCHQSQNLLELMSVELVLPPTISPSVVPFSSCIFLSIRVFSNESVLHIRWPEYWSFSFNISPSNEYPGLISFRMAGWISLQSKGLSRVFSNTTIQKHQFFGAQPSL